MQSPIAAWSSTRDRWETDALDMLSGLSAVYLETFPRQGLMLNGQLFPHPELELPTVENVSAFSPIAGVSDLLPTPAASAPNDAEDIATWDARRARVKAKTGNGNGMGEPLGVAVRRLQLLPTPKASDGEKGGPNQRGSAGDPTLPSAVMDLLPTPTASDANGIGVHGTGGLDLRTTVALFPTPKASDGLFSLPRTSGRPPEKSTHLATRLHYTDFGKYRKAVERWELLLGVPSPPPLVPRGRGGALRLNPGFAEWMMGLPEGHITDPELGLTTNEQLTAIGNGVVPQQGAHVLSWMLSWLMAATQPVVAGVA